MELHVRGIDSYIWVEGYVIRGPNAGASVKAVIPYMPNRTQTALTKPTERASGPAK